MVRAYSAYTAEEHRIASNLIRQELAGMIDSDRLDKFISEMNQRYTGDEIVRVAEAIQRFGLEPILGAVVAPAR